MKYYAVIKSDIFKTILNEIRKYPFFNIKQEKDKNNIFIVYFQLYYHLKMCVCV